MGMHFCNKSLFKENWLVFYMLALVVFKLIVAGGIPLYVRAHQTYDDYLMVSHALNLLNGDWLGLYNSLTLTKGIFFPVFLAVSYFLNINFQTAQILFHAGACISFVYIMNNFIRNKAFCAIGFFFLFFDPVTMSTNTFLMVYRCNILPAEVLYLLAFFMGIHLKIGTQRKEALFFSICAGMALSMIWNTREDTIWVLPMLFFLIICSLAFNKEHKKRCCLYFLIPFIITMSINQAICFANYIYYGTYNRTELSGGNFPGMMKAIYAIQPDEWVEKVSVPRGTIDKLYQESKAFSELRPYIEANYSVVDAADTHLDGHIRDGWFFWFLRDAIHQKCKTAAEAGAYYEKIAQEINLAFSKGTLEKRKTMSMPSALMSPYRTGYLRETLKAMYEGIKYMVKYQDAQLELRDSVGNKSAIKDFEMLTLSHAYQPQYNFQMSGWIFSKSNSNHLNLVMEMRDGTRKKLDRISSPDVYSAFLAKDKLFSDANKARFFVNERMETRQDLPVKLLIEENGKVDGEIAFKDPMKGFFENERLAGNIESFHLQDDQELPHIVKKKIRLINKFNNVYKFLMLPVFSVAVLVYMGLCGFSFMKAVKRQKNYFYTEWLLLTAILIGFITLLFGVSYTHISAFSALFSIYLAPAYPLLLVFSVISCSLLYRVIKLKIS